jgi:hypothetical protein
LAAVRRTGKTDFGAFGFSKLLIKNSFSDLSEPGTRYA